MENQAITLCKKAGNLIMLDRPEEALELFNEALSLKKNDCSIWYFKATALKELGRIEEAMDALNHSLSINSRHISSLFLKGLISKEAGNYNEAIKLFNQILSIDSNHYLALFSIGKLLLHQNILDENGLTYINRGLTICPNDIDALIQKVTVLMAAYDEKKYTEALQLVDKILDIDNECFPAWFCNSELLLFVGRYKECIAACDKALDLSKSDVNRWAMDADTMNIHLELLHWKTDAARLMGNDILAIKTNMEAEKLVDSNKEASDYNEKNCKVWYMRGSILAIQGDAKSALEIFDICIGIDKFYLLAWQAKAEILDAQGRSGEADIAKMMVKKIQGRPGI